MRKIPHYKGDLSRSLQFLYQEDVENFVKQYSVGNTVTYSEFLSTTFGSTYNPDGQVQIYIAKSKLGCDISKYNDEEKEVLYARNSRFKVIEYEKKMVYTIFCSRRSNKWAKRNHIPTDDGRIYLNAQ